MSNTDKEYELDLQRKCARCVKNNVHLCISGVVQRMSEVDAEEIMEMAEGSLLGGYVTCPAEGCDEGWTMPVCPDCSGTGEGPNEDPCRTCNGEGSGEMERCSECSGEGEILVEVYEHWAVNP